jgi:hypothetical protein
LESANCHPIGRKKRAFSGVTGRNPNLNLALAGSVCFWKGLEATKDTELEESTHISSISFVAFIVGEVSSSRENGISWCFSAPIGFMWSAVQDIDTTYAVTRKLVLRRHFNSGDT